MKENKISFYTFQNIEVLDTVTQSNLFNRGIYNIQCINNPINKVIDITLKERNFYKGKNTLPLWGMVSHDSSIVKMTAMPKSFLPIDEILHADNTILIEYRVSESELKTKALSISNSTLNSVNLLLTPENRSHSKILPLELIPISKRMRDMLKKGVIRLDKFGPTFNYNNVLLPCLATSKITGIINPSCLIGQKFETKQDFVKFIHSSPMYVKMEGGLYNVDNIRAYKTRGVDSK